MSITLFPVTAEACLRAVTLLASEALHSTGSRIGSGSGSGENSNSNSNNDTLRNVYEDSGNVRVRIVGFGGRSLLEAFQALDGNGMNDGAATSLMGMRIGIGGSGSGSVNALLPRMQPIHVQDALRRGDDMCCICYERYAEDAEYQDVVELPCAHTFHAACVRDWHRHSPACPLCRRVPSAE